MYPLPTTHELVVSTPFHLAEREPQNPRYGLSGYALYLAGFLLGRRTQFHDWRVFDATPVHDGHCSFCGAAHDVEQALDQSIVSWDRLTPENRVRVVNVLFLAGAIEGLRFEWERFALAFQLLDTTFRVAVELGEVTDVNGHRQRIRNLCAGLGLAHAPDETVIPIVTTRNRFVHELLWHGHMIGHGYDDDPVEASLEIRCLLERAVISVLGIQADFIGSPWWGVHARQRVALEPE